MRLGFDHLPADVALQCALLSLLGDQVVDGSHSPCLPLSDRIRKCGVLWGELLAKLFEDSISLSHKTPRDNSGNPLIRRGRVTAQIPQDATLAPTRRHAVGAAGSHKTPQSGWLSTGRRSLRLGRGSGLHPQDERSWIWPVWGWPIIRPYCRVT